MAGRRGGGDKAERLGGWAEAARQGNWVEGRRGGRVAAASPLMAGRQAGGGGEREDAGAFTSVLVTQSVTA